jgi:hypothetical protein
MFLLLQLGVMLAMLMYLWQCKASLHRRNRESWQSLMAQLEQWPPDLATPWIRFQRARVLLEIADYAELHGSQLSGSLDPVNIESIRKNALEDRISALTAMLKSVLLKSGQTRSV